MKKRVLTLILSGLLLIVPLFGLADPAPAMWKLGLFNEDKDTVTVNCGGPHGFAVSMQGGQYFSWSQTFQLPKDSGNNINCKISTASRWFQVNNLSFIKDSSDRVGLIFIVLDGTSNKTKSKIKGACLVVAYKSSATPGIELPNNPYYKCDWQRARAILTQFY